MNERGSAEKTEACQRLKDLRDELLKVEGSIYALTQCREDIKRNVAEASAKCCKLSKGGETEK